MYENEEPQFQIAMAGDRTPEDREEPNPGASGSGPEERDYWRDNDRPLTRESPGGMYGDERGGQKSENKED